MLKKKSNYLSILKLELEDLKTDIELLIKKCCEDKEEDNISNYVFMENLTLFNNEILGVNVFHTIIDDFASKIDEYSDLEEMIDKLKDTFMDKMKEFGVSKAIYLSILRKMDKVKSYVMQ
ncbi:MAG: hypothetical protein JXK07_13195 [Spirochaetes bacterium]|nr:hypothetical protein [Spirochaetota bacterium]MBN2769785.1 hypothetical protein [Spirochaetota bacterium]